MTKPTTNEDHPQAGPQCWEEAAREADDLIFHTYSEIDSLDDVDRELDGPPVSPEDFARIGAYALWRAGEDRDQTLGATLNDIVDTVIAKQHDYGHGNILRHGITGIVVRMCDKVERIRNLERRIADAKGIGDFIGSAMESSVAKNEPLADGWNDLVGYSIIGIMLLNGTFELPLAADIKQTITITDGHNWVVPSDARSIHLVGHNNIGGDFAVAQFQTEAGDIWKWSNTRGVWVYCGRMPQ